MFSSFAASPTDILKSPVVLMMLVSQLSLLTVLSSALSINQKAIGSQVSNVSNALAAINTLQQWYNESTGLWDTTGWWNSANALIVLANYNSLDPAFDNVAHHVYQNTLRQAQQANHDFRKVIKSNTVDTFMGSHPIPNHLRRSSITFPGFINTYYDDEGWWALAWLKVYDNTKQQQYLETAMSIFKDMTTGWGAPCGGMWWSKDYTYTGAIENELFLMVAAQLANRASTKQYYLDWALKEWDWFENTGMINSHYNIINGMDFKTCKSDNGTVWSYNQGVILGGLVELNYAVPNTSYLEMAEKIASAAIEKLSDSNGILHEPCEPNCGADGPQFKGIFMRNLQKLENAQPNDRFRDFINKNADSIWLTDRGSNSQLGLVWSGPFTSATASTQTSACDALVAAIAGNATG